MKDAKINKLTCQIDRWNLPDKLYQIVDQQVDLAKETLAQRRSFAHDVVLLTEFLV